MIPKKPAILTAPISPLLLRLMLFVNPASPCSISSIFTLQLAPFHAPCPSVALPCVYLPTLSRLCTQVQSNSGQMPNKRRQEIPVLSCQV